MTLEPHLRSYGLSAKMYEHIGQTA